LKTLFETQGVRGESDKRTLRGDMGISAINPLQPRRFLFLQGNASRFFGDLAKRLLSRGHTVRKINFNGGDVLFWPHRGAANYTGDITGWENFLQNYLLKEDITDILLLGDCRPLHSIAINVANRLNITVFVFEEGYMRPNWITLEQGGVNAYSSLGRTPEWFFDRASKLPDWVDPQLAVNSMWRRAIEDIAYVTSTALASIYFRNYKTHRPWSSWVEYTGGARRFLRKSVERDKLNKTVKHLQATKTPYYIFPLQLEADSQIQNHSPFSGIAEVLDFTITSFAKQAHDNAHLIITEHPLDTSPYKWREIIRDLCRQHSVVDRVSFYEGGSPDAIIAGSRSVITVNSTLGYLALSLGKPLIALGTAIYGLPGLTFQGGLDAFWTAAQPPNPDVFDAFRRVVAAYTQVNGSFYGAAGLALAVEGAAARLEALHSHSDAAPQYVAASQARRRTTVGLEQVSGLSRASRQDFKRRWTQGDEA
jgi:capsular polysaccharide export protein